MTLIARTIKQTPTTSIYPVWRAQVYDDQTERIIYHAPTVHSNEQSAQEEAETFRRFAETIQ